MPSLKAIRGRVALLRDWTRARFMITYGSTILLFSAQIYNFLYDKYEFTTCAPPATLSARLKVTSPTAPQIPNRVTYTTHRKPQFLLIKRQSAKSLRRGQSSRLLRRPLQGGTQHDAALDPEVGPVEHALPQRHFLARRVHPVHGFAIKLAWNWKRDPHKSTAYRLSGHVSNRSAAPANCTAALC